MKYDLAAFTPRYVWRLNGAEAVIGLDLGSRASKGALITGKRLFVALVATGLYMQETADELVTKLCDEASVTRRDVRHFGGYCISRKSYEKCISESNIRANKRVKDYGAKIVIHTCGPYDDRFDLVLKESGDAWHISDTQTKKVADEYGDKVALMGNIPCCSVLMDGTPEEACRYAYRECMDAVKGRFILSGDCDVPPPTTDENIKAVVRAAKDAEKVLFGEADTRGA
ncbi:MAG: hypothetical protein LBF92_01695 [Synergistaceae bacterium]|jgi:hypothetical protein|nr:hypothetical protein [Synergistaceae bacterium]